MEERFYYDDPEAPAPNVPLKPGVAAILFDDQLRILIMKRTRGPYWSIPGGRQDLGESSPECCIRETEEETGLSTEVVRLIGLYTHAGSICAYPDGNVHQSFIALYECKVLCGGLRESAEGGKFHWLAEAELDNYMLLPDNVLCVRDAWAGGDQVFLR
ncbi:MAG: NUDIX domain-containing protein [Chthonomonadales bacterium]